MATGTLRALAWTGVLALVAVGGLGALQAQEQSLPAESPAQGFFEIQSFLIGDLLGLLVFVGGFAFTAAVVAGLVGKWRAGSGGMGR